ncbi:MAG: GGDEF domain-containing protein [Clostridia bacterium]|nr:GGDEF domain-containing protein [Clostridia bacterium]
MSDYIIYYTESNIVCLIIFCIMLIHDLRGVDRQEKQVKYDHALIAFMCYFVSDALWAAVIAGVIPRTEFTVAILNFTNYIFMAAITYMWLNYVMAVEQTPHRNRRINKFAVLFPFIVSTVALIAVYIFAPGALLDGDLNTKPLYNVFLVAVPAINIAAELFYALRKAKGDTNPIERLKHVYVGLLPVLVILGGLFQLAVLPNTPIFCYCCAILMIIFYIRSMETSISLDPLTGLNNRGQLIRFISQKSMTQTPDKHLFVIMMDVNDFKGINDTYGHAEGDAALVTIADSLKSVSNKSTMTQFIGRYGGDEFIMIVQADRAEDVDSIISDIRAQIDAACKAAKTPYALTIGAGYDEFSGEGDSFRNCIQRADRKLYIDKENIKKHGKSTVVRRKEAG